MRHIVHIIPENSSSLDFTLPIFWKNSISNNPNYKFSVIFFYLNKKAVLKNSCYYEEVGSKAGVEFYDLSDFLNLPNIIKKIIKPIYSFSNTDKIRIKSIGMLKGEQTKIAQIIQTTNQL